MAGTITKRACFLLLAQVVLLRALDGQTVEPKCISKFDYDYKLMHLVVELESHLKKINIASKEKLADVINRTEVLEQKIQELTNRLHAIDTEVDSLPRWNQWTEWSECYVNCTGPSGGRLQTRTRTGRNSTGKTPLTESESRPCNAVQFAGCVKTSSHADDEYAIAYDYQDMTAQATCTAVGKGHVRAIRRDCAGPLTCLEVCKNVEATCFNALHVYANQPVPKRGETGTKGPMVYKYDGCDGVFCGPNYCCCNGK